MLSYLGTGPWGLMQLRITRNWRQPMSGHNNPWQKILDKKREDFTPIPAYKAFLTGLLSPNPIVQEVSKPNSLVYANKSPVVSPIAIVSEV